MSTWNRTVIIALAAGLALSASANNIAVSNIVLKNQAVAEKSVFVEFDLSWDNSWRNELNHDAAWVFVKFRAPGSNNWEHAFLSTNNAAHAPLPAGAEIIAGDDGVGVFVRSALSQTGSVAYTRTRLLWEYGSNGYEFAKGDLVDISVHAVEMVYVDEGAFYVGSGGIEQGSFTEGSWVSGGTFPFAITNESALMITNSANCLWGTAISGNSAIGDPGELLVTFPKGFAAFYCMKYEITQGQYADFLNMLTRAQQATRCSAVSQDCFMGGSDGVKSPWSRNYVWVSDATSDPDPRVYAADRPDRACNWMSWADVVAYADWSGLRPMTELEFEKACRGPAGPVTNEYAWGTNTIMVTAKTLSGAEDGTETVTTSAVLGGCHYGNVAIIGGDEGIGPLRAGIFATNNASRLSSGASYWGIMELSGNVWERVVTIGNATGRSFTGLHGNGMLNAGGDADVNAWPNTTATGSGFRGGAGDFVATHARASDRNLAALGHANRYYYTCIGGRAVRSAPSGVGP